MSAALKLSIDRSTLSRLETAAAARNMTPEALAEAAVEMFLVEQSSDEAAPRKPWQVALIEEGLAAADRGDFASDEEVARIFDTYRE